MAETIYNTEQIRCIERMAIKTYQISEDSLMERAGYSAFSNLKATWPYAEKILVVCGRGNNAGDGYTLAKLAKQEGLEVLVLQLAPITALKGVAARAAKHCLAAEVPCETFTTKKLTQFKPHIIVDALLGIGFKGRVRLPYLKAIKAINAYKEASRLLAFHDVSILSLDLPSGLDPNTAAYQDEAIIEADLTITFIGLKIGLLMEGGTHYAGRVVLDCLGIPSSAYKEIDKQAIEALSGDYISTCIIKVRRRNSHKGDCGHVLVVGGNKGFLGAAIIAGCAAARVGSGLVSIATHPSHASLVAAHYPELMSHGVETSEQLSQLLDRATVIVLGPGLGQDAWAEHLLKTLLKQADSKPKVIDADALNMLSNRLDWLKKIKQGHHTILTPHPGEAARLLGLSSSEAVQLDRLTALEKLQSLSHCHVVLKGAGTLVSAPPPNKAQKSSHDNYRPGLCTLGNPGMATGGMGDLLSGVIGGLLAQNFEPAIAVRLGVSLHAAAADQDAGQNGERGMIATDLLPYLRSLMNPF